MAIHPEDREAWEREGLQAFLRDPLHGRTGLRGWYAGAQYQAALDEAAADRLDDLEAEVQMLRREANLRLARAV